MHVSIWQRIIYWISNLKVFDMIDGIVGGENSPVKSVVVGSKFAIELDCGKKLNN